MNHPFPVLAPEYAALIPHARVTRATPVRLGIERVMDNLSRYIELSEATGGIVPAPFLGALDLRESDCNPALGLGQGDPWREVSRHVPAGQGPFPSWVAAGAFYVHYDHLTDTTAPYSLEYECWKGEKWNGFGPRNHGRHTGYLWACTAVYDPPRLGGEGLGGKYTGDGEWSPDVVDVQPGIIPVILGIHRLRPDLAAPRALPTIQAPTVVPLVKPAPEGLGQGLSGTSWLQLALNQVLRLDPALMVNGNYDRRTVNAVRLFQTQEGLHVDGLAGETQTLPALRRVLASGALAVPPAAKPLSPTMPMLRRMRVTAPHGLNVRKMPSPSGDVIEVLRFGQEVVTSFQGTTGPGLWANVGDEDKPRGWVASQFLEPVAKN